MSELASETYTVGDEREHATRAAAIRRYRTPAV
jgi:hypothetical protein